MTDRQTDRLDSQHRPYQAGKHYNVSNRIRKHRSGWNDDALARSRVVSDAGTDEVRLNCYDVARH